MTARPRGLDGYIAERRRLLGLSQSRAATLAGASRTSWVAWEKGTATPEDYSYVKIERALEWQPGSVAGILAGGEPTPIPEPEPIPIDPDLERAKEAYKVWIRKYPTQAEADAKLDEYIRMLLAERKRAKSGSSDRRDIDQQTTSTFG